MVIGRCGRRRHCQDDGRARIHCAARRSNLAVIRVAGDGVRHHPGAGGCALNNRSVAPPLEGSWLTAARGGNAETHRRAGADVCSRHSHRRRDYRGGAALDEGDRECVSTRDRDRIREVRWRHRQAAAHIGAPAGDHAVAQDCHRVFHPRPDGSDRRPERLGGRPAFSPADNLAVSLKGERVVTASRDGFDGRKILRDVRLRPAIRAEASNCAVGHQAH